MDIIGKVFGKLKCLEEVEKPKSIKSNYRYYTFECECGSKYVTSDKSVTRKKGTTTKCPECSKKDLRTNMIGKTFGELTCIKELDERYQDGSVKYLFKCSCGGEREASGVHVRQKIVLRCQECVNELRRKDKNVDWQGYGEISKTWWQMRVIKRAKKRKQTLNVEITIEHAWKLFLKQNRQCALSGVKLFFPRVNSEYSSGNASLDRINPDLGYVEGNVQWVHKDVNMAKQSLQENEFIEMCRKITSYTAERNLTIIN